MLKIDNLNVSLEEENKQIIKGLSLSVMPMSFFWLPFVKGIGSNINVGPGLFSWFGKLVKLNVQCVKSRRGGKLC